LTFSSRKKPAGRWRSRISTIDWKRVPARDRECHASCRHSRKRLDTGKPAVEGDREPAPRRDIREGPASTMSPPAVRGRRHRRADRRRWPRLCPPFSEFRREPETRRCRRRVRPCGAESEERNAAESVRASRSRIGEVSHSHRTTTFHPEFGQRPSHADDRVPGSPGTSPAQYSRFEGRTRRPRDQGRHADAQKQTVHEDYDLAGNDHDYRAGPGKIAAMQPKTGHRDDCRQGCGRLVPAVRVPLPRTGGHDARTLSRK